MDGPFSEEEKRFLVCEVIRASGLSLGAIVAFIKRNNIEPNWMHMRFPQNRTPGDAMKAAEDLTILPAGAKRKFADDQDERVAKRPGLPPGIDPKLLNTGHKPILPRPPSNSAEPQPAPVQPAPPPQGPKKRGRPSQLDRAKRAPAPVLPQLAPRPSDSNQTAQSSNTDQAPAPVAQNTSSSTSDPTAGYSTSSRRETRSKAKSSRTQARNNDRVSPAGAPIEAPAAAPAVAPAADPGLSHSSTPRIMPDYPAAATASQARAVYPAPIEPRPMMTTQPHSSVPGSLPALLDRGGEAASMQPHYAEAAPPLANSA